MFGNDTFCSKNMFGLNPISCFYKTDPGSGSKILQDGSRIWVQDFTGRIQDLSPRFLQDGSRIWVKSGMKPINASLAYYLKKKIFPNNIVKNMHVHRTYVDLEFSK